MRELIKVLWGVSIVTCLLLSGCDLKEKFERSVNIPLPIGAGQKLLASVNVGSIKVTGDDAKQPSLKAKITGRGDTVEKAKIVAEAIKLTVVNENNNVIIKIDKPAEIKNDWFMLDYTISAPKGISLEYEINVGSITISNIEGNITATSNVGNVTAENARGISILRTNVGNIRLVYAEDANSVAVNASVNVGNLYFKGPKNLSAMVNASSDVGSIHSALPITVQGNICSKSLKGIIGTGQGSVNLATNVGSIKIE